MPQEHAFDFDRGDVFAAADDDVLEAVADFEVAVRMHDGGVAAVEPAVANGLGGVLRIAVVARHHDVAANDDFAEGLAVAGDVASEVIDDPEVAGGDEFDALAGFDGGTGGGVEVCVFGARFADGDERRDFGEPVNLGDLPAEFALDALDGGGGGGRTGGKDAQAAGGEAAQFVGGVGDADEDGGRGAEEGDGFADNVLEDGAGFGLAKAHVGRAHGGDNPDEGPPVGVKHRDGPEIAIGAGHVQVHQGADGIEPGIAMGDHHTLGAGGGAAGVVEGEEVVLVDFHRHESLGRGGESLVVIQPAVLAAFEGDEVGDVGDLAADAVQGVEVIGVCADHAGTAVVDDIGEVVGVQAVVDRHGDGADLRHGVEGFELRRDVGGDVGDAVARADAELLQGGGPAVAPVEELAIGAARGAINEGFAVGVELAGAAGEIEGSEWCFHGIYGGWGFGIRKRLPARGRSWWRCRA